MLSTLAEVQRGQGLRALSLVTSELGELGQGT